MDKTAPTIVQPNSVTWKPVSGMAGLEEAVLWGDPSKEGSVYAERYKVSAGFKFPPHTHPQAEQVTVLSGTFLVGVGKTMDETKMLALAPGSFVGIPAGLPHYAMAKTATVLEIHGVGPDTIQMIK
jgi:quercetin dioxygenase-like cupin family protein